jgi:pimeloyl-[acyl-carrier protein] methyl ester esterase
MTAAASTAARRGDAAHLHVESAGRGRPLVLLHGFALHGGLFAPLVPALAQRHRVHVVDLPGHGHSDPIDPWTIDAVVAALERAFVAERQPLAVLGWSLGGVIALAWALAHPQRLRRLVLVGTSPRFVAGDAWPHAMAPQMLARFGDELSVAWKLTLQRFLSLQVQGSEAGHATLAALRHQLFARGAPDPATLAAALDALAGTDLRGDVARIALPTLVVAGESDTLARPEAAAWLAQALPAAELLRVPGAGHVPFLSHPDAFRDALLRFLADG